MTEIVKYHDLQPIVTAGVPDPSFHLVDHVELVPFVSVSIVEPYLLALEQDVASLTPLYLVQKEHGDRVTRNANLTYKDTDFGTDYVRRLNVRLELEEAYVCHPCYGLLSRGCG